MYFQPEACRACGGEPQHTFGDPRLQVDPDRLLMGFASLYPSYGATVPADGRVMG
jgi:hypothetical protein